MSTKYNIWLRIGSQTRKERGKTKGFFVGGCYCWWPRWVFVVVVVGDPFNVDAQGLGSVGSVQELGGQARWVGRWPTPGRRRGCPEEGWAQVRQGK